jgi:hypothetical protein
VKIDKEKGFEKVLTDALGVGEDHTGSSGRNYVKQLIDKNLVTNLYMEIPEDIWLKVKLMVKPEMDNEKLEAITKGYIGDLWKNTESPLWKLVAYAISRKVWIGCFDRAGGDEGEEFLNARDELAAKRINAVMEEEGRAKNVILYGALHFEDTRPGRKGKTLADLCKLDYVLFDN